MRRNVTTLGVIPPLLILYLPINFSIIQLALRADPIIIVARIGTLIDLGVLLLHIH